MEKDDFSSMQGLIQDDTEGDGGAEFQKYMRDIAISLKQIEGGIRQMAESSGVQRKVEVDEIKELTKSGPGADARSSSGVVVVSVFVASLITNLLTLVQNTYMISPAKSARQVHLSNLVNSLLYISLVLSIFSTLIASGIFHVFKSHRLRQTKEDIQHTDLLMRLGFAFGAVCMYIALLAIALALVVFGWATQTSAVAIVITTVSAVAPLVWVLLLRFLWIEPPWYKGSPYRRPSSKEYLHAS